ncbi:MAG: DegT/DnrJ/EryC1/StrS family aminotransferase [Flavobacteriaceae bacterium]
MSQLPFIDLGAQRRRLGERVDEAILKVVNHGAYIMGPEVGELEEKLAEFCGASHAISCSSGTDALAMILMAKGVGPGDAVICPSFTFAATGEVVAWLGATPVFADCLPDTFNLDPESLRKAILKARELTLKPVGVIAVDLFGQPADYEAIEPICSDEGLWLLCDTAQGFGGTYKGRRTGSIGDIAATSFFPAKPLGCYGDGGAIFTDDGALAGIIRSIRNHGQGSDKYDNVRIGMNGRLDTIQAAVLLEKLEIFPDEIVARQLVAERYNEGLGNLVITPLVAEGCVSTWAQYTIRLSSSRRAAFADHLKEAGIPTAIYYPKPMHMQSAYRRFPIAQGGLPVCEKLAGEVISLPMHPYLDEETQDRIIDAARAALAAEAA